VVNSDFWFPLGLAYMPIGRAKNHLANETFRLYIC
ncbi:MAG: hypothetical protein ACI9FU_000477, partial [Granulosicoccus sp.]